jgi:hypothetical protein
MPGLGEAAVVRLGDEVEGARYGGGVKSPVPDLYDRPLVTILGQDRSLWFPDGGMSATSF